MVKGLLIIKTEESYRRIRSNLKDRYGNEDVISKGYTDKIENWGKIGNNDHKNLRKFADFLEQIVAIKQSVKSLGILDFAKESKIILDKLPYYVSRKWNDVVLVWKERYGNGSYPTFERLTNFVNREADRVNLPELTSQNSTSRNTYKQTKGSDYQRRNQSFSTMSSTSSEMCLCCNETHDLDECTKFMAFVETEKKDFFFKYKLCFGCGKSGHVAGKCMNKATCKKCKKKHLTCLHRDQVKGDAKCTSVCGSSVRISYNSMVLPVWVRIKDSKKEILCYCVLDDQSNMCFMSDELKENLGVSGVNTQLLLSTLHGKDLPEESMKIENVEVLSYDKNSVLSLPSVFTRAQIPVDDTKIPKPEVAKKWPHLEGLAKSILPYDKSIGTHLLIGHNVPAALRPREVVASGENEPYAQKSVLGWGIVGEICRSNGDKSSKSSRVSYCLRTNVKEILNPMQIQKMMELDFSDHKSVGDSFSVEDKLFVDKMKKHIRKLPDGHYEMPLPLKHENVVFPNNKELAFSRLKQQSRKFKHDKTLKEAYVKSITDVIKKYAEEVPVCTELSFGKLNYVPHFAVTHSKKPGKVRIVFDFSAEFEGTSLNNNLLQGPDLLNGLLGILCRFRKENIAIMADVEAMFYQFLVPESDRYLLRFLWWRNNDPQSDVIEYRLRVHPFGAVSSPCCANFGLKYAADDGQEKFGCAAADFVRENFYVDDGLISVSNEQEAIELIDNSVKICKSAGMRLHKFSSNSKIVLDSIPESERSKNMLEVNIGEGHLPMEHALGITWCIESDSFRFRIELKDTPLNRRSILRTIYSIYDPISLIGPILIEGKMILQQLCKDGVGWDEEVPSDIRMRWTKWRDQLLSIEKLRINRCFRPKDFGKVESVEFHHFSDASERAYGQCSYIRLINTAGKSHCSFVIGKARVAPLKKVTIPRLELNAAVVSAKMSNFIDRQLKYENVKHFFWVDSKVVIGYVQNEARRFQTFVANRIQQIRDLTEPLHWNYVESQNNPSDEASRGMSADKFLSKSFWLSGPEFLHKPGAMNYTSCDINESVAKEIKMEMRKATVFNTQVKLENILDLERFRSFHHGII